MSYPNADTASLVNYYLASRQVEQSNAAFIAELKEVIKVLMATPGVSPELLERARATLADEDDL